MIVDKFVLIVNKNNRCVRMCKSDKEFERMESVCVFKLGLRSLIQSISYTRQSNFLSLSENSKLTVSLGRRAPVGFQKVFYDRRVFMLVKVSGCVSDIICIGQIT